MLLISSPLLWRGGGDFAHGILIFYLVYNSNFVDKGCFGPFLGPSDKVDAMPELREPPARPPQSQLFNAITQGSLLFYRFACTSVVGEGERPQAHSTVGL